MLLMKFVNFFWLKRLSRFLTKINSQRDRDQRADVHMSVSFGNAIQLICNRVSRIKQYLTRRCLTIVGRILLKRMCISCSCWQNALTMRLRLHSEKAPMDKADNEYQSGILIF